LCYEGNFHNDKYHNTDAKVFYSNGNVKYEGEMKKGLKDGVGSFSYENGQL
jgi:antitoxin component YwqK of YwqJK toxin-antitoxin module